MTLWASLTAGFPYSLLLPLKGPALVALSSRSLALRTHGGPRPKLQALVYDILPSTTAVFSNAIGSRKLSANEQFVVGAQTAVSLLQTSQILSDVCFITDQVAYASSNKTKIV